MLYKYWKFHRRLWNALAKKDEYKTEAVSHIRDKYNISFDEAYRIYGLRDCAICVLANKEITRANKKVCHTNQQKCKYCHLQWTPFDKKMRHANQIPCYNVHSLYYKWCNSYNSMEKHRIAALIACMPPKKWNYGKYSW